MGAAPPQHERRELSASAERRLLQAAVALGCLIPISAGGVGIVRGPAFLKGAHGPLPVDLESHFHYLSGLLLGIGLGFAACIPGIERRGPIFRTLGLIVIVGGLGRLSGLLRDGPPSAGHMVGLVMELGAMPLLLLWQARVSRLFGAIA